MPDVFHEGPSRGADAAACISEAPDTSIISVVHKERTILLPS